MADKLHNRSQQEILDHLKKISKDDVFAFQTNDLIPYLEFDNVKKAAPEVTVDKEEFAKITAALKSPADEIKDYMSFAIGKARNHRGLSAMRSLEHMKAYIWLDGREPLLKEMLEMSTTNYGAPVLKRICEAYSLSWPEDEDINNMAQGKPCREGCQEGCGQ